MMGPQNKGNGQACANQHSPKDEKKLIAFGYTVHIVTNSRAEVTTLPEDLLNKMREQKALIK